MNALARFEAFMQELMDRRMVRLLGGTLQPVDIAHALARAIEDHAVDGWTPSDFQVLANPSDAAELREMDPALDAKLAEVAVELARERGLNFASAPRVQLLADPDVQAGNVRVQALGAASPPFRGAQGDSGRHARQDPPGILELLVPEDGSRIARLPVERFPFTIGRRPGNALVLPDAAVSREHAAIDQMDGHFRLRDLGSHNGTILNGQAVAEADLRDGDRVRIGGFELVVRVSR
ncbi:MAG TPA: FhaA domain-containing protein [Chloroflexota bacterium]|nr:FhaA domain-containing protein [Chloroflexota bacterium]